MWNMKMNQLEEAINVPFRKQYILDEPYYISK